MKKTVCKQTICSAFLAFAFFIISINAEASSLPGPITSMTLSNYSVNGSDIQLTSIYSQGTATATFSGSTGTYSIALSVSATTSTGGDKYALLVNGVTVGTYTTPTPPTSGSWTFVSVFKNVSIAEGNTIEVTGTSSNHSLAQVNSLTFTLTSAPASCTFNGNTIASGSSVTAYLASSVPSGSTCSSQTRTCTNGTLSGTYTYASCTVAAGAVTNSFKASLNPVAPGQTITFTGNINAGVTATNVKVNLWILNSTGTQVGVASGSGYNFTVGQTTPVSLSYTVPQTLLPAPTRTI